MKFAVPAQTCGLLQLSLWGFGSPQFIVPTSHLWISLARFVGGLTSSLLCCGATIPCLMLLFLIWALCPGARAPPSTERDGAPLMYSSVFGRTWTQRGPTRIFCFPGVPRGGLPGWFRWAIGRLAGPPLDGGPWWCGTPPYAFL